MKNDILLSQTTEWLRSSDSDLLEEILSGDIEIFDGFLGEVEINIIKTELRKRKLKKLKWIADLDDKALEKLHEDKMQELINYIHQCQKEVYSFLYETKIPTEPLIQNIKIELRKRKLKKISYDRKNN